MNKAGILGTGLIGASMGQGLRAAGWEISAWDPDRATLRLAADLGAVDHVCADIGEVVATEPDVLVLAGPPDAVVVTVAAIETASLVIDVSGVKAAVIDAARPARFIGTHPMAGRERSGPRAASPSLFRGAAWVIVGEDADEGDLLLVNDIILTLGARPISMTAQEHDDAVAMISHIPQVLASLLVTEASASTRALDLAAGSFRDLTRVAASDPKAWTQLLLANRDSVRSGLDNLRRGLDDLARRLEEGDGEYLYRYLERARTARHSLAPPVVAVRVALADEPGELSRVGIALEKSAVDVRDLQLRHAPYGGGGVLTLSVRPGEAETLRSAVTAEGLLLAE